MDFWISELLLDQIETQVWYLTDEQTCGGANRAYADFLGLDKEELKNVDLFDVHDEEEEAKVCIENNKQVIETGDKIHTEELVNNYKGEKKLLSITKTPVFDSKGYVSYIICSAEDITEKREYETKLKENDELFREITENMLDMVSLTDKHGYFSYVGPSHEIILGYRPQYLVGRNVLDFVHPDDIEWLKKEYEIFLKSLKPKKIEYRYLHADGYYLWLETIGNVIYDNQGNVKKFIFGSREITERKSMEQELKNTYHIINNSPAVAFVWDSDRESGWPVEYVSENVGDIFGYTVDDFVNASLNYADIIHPDDIERVESEVNENSSDPCIVKFQHEPYRIITKEGSVRWVDDRTYIKRDENNVIKQFQGIVLDVTERKIAEEKLESSKKFLDSIFESIQDGISIVDPDFNVLSVNNKMNEWYMENTPLENKKCYQVFHNRNHPCGTCPTRRAFKTGTTEMDIVPGYPGSNVSWLELYSYPVVDSDTGDIPYVVEFLRDITERVEAENELQKSRNMLNNIIQCIPVGICMTDKNGYFDNVNPAYCDIAGYKCDELIGKHFTTIVPEGYKKELSNLHDRFIDGSYELSGEWPITDKFGNQKTILANAAKVQDIDDEPKKATFIIDITKRKHTENKLQEYSRELEKLNETREIFTDILRHDLLNPVSIIKGFTELLYKNETDEKKIHMLEKVKDNNEKALELIENAGNLAKIECMDNIEFHLLDIGEVIQDSIENLKSTIDEKYIKIKYENLSGYYSYLNPVIEQAFTNLISNSIKYSPEDSDIVVDIIDEIDYWKVCIKDSGPGIPDEDKEIIFDRFRQGEGKKVSGKGLGLAIVREIVEIHDGSVGVTDNPDDRRGSMFWIRLKKAR